MWAMFSLVRSSGCPNCGSGSASLYRSKRHGVAEFLLHHLLHITPYRCKECGVRHTLCSDTGLCAEGDAAGIPRRRAFWTCRVTRCHCHSLDNRRIALEKTWPTSPNLGWGKSIHLLVKILPCFRRHAPHGLRVERLSFFLSICYVLLDNT